MVNRLGQAPLLFSIARASGRFRRLLALEPAALARFRDAQVQKLARHAFLHVPLYRDKWRAAGVHPRDLCGVADLARLPLLSREELSAEPPERRIAEGTRLATSWQLTSTGSTGSAVSVYFDRSRVAAELGLVAATHRLELFGRPIRRPLLVTVCAEDAIEWLVARALPAYAAQYVDALGPLPAIVDAINRVRPDCLVTYPSVLASVCAHVQDKGSTLYQPGIIQLTGEAAPANLRRHIASVFSALVLSRYGATETGNIASELPGRDGLHVFDQKVIVEAVTDQGAACARHALGNLVVTDLWNFASPLIRYAGLGDLVRLDDQGARFLTRITALEGRRADVLVSSDGRRIHPFALTSLLQRVPAIRRFQIQQHERSSLRILVESKDACLPAAVHAEVTRQVRALFGDDMRVDLEVVAHIPIKDGTHKTPVVVSSL